MLPSGNVGRVTLVGRLPIVAVVRFRVANLQSSVAEMGRQPTLPSQLFATSVTFKNSSPFKRGSISMLKHPNDEAAVLLIPKITVGGRYCLNQGLALPLNYLAATAATIAQDCL
jgi:hypothetical protein